MGEAQLEEQLASKRGLSVCGTRETVQVLGHRVPVLVEKEQGGKDVHLNSAMKRFGAELFWLFGIPGVADTLRENPNTQLTPEVNIVDFFIVLQKEDVFNQLEYDQTYTLPGVADIEFSTLSKSEASLSGHDKYLEYVVARSNTISLGINSVDGMFVATLMLVERAIDGETEGISFRMQVCGKLCTLEFHIPRDKDEGRRPIVYATSVIPMYLDEKNSVPLDVYKMDAVALGDIYRRMQEG